MDIVRNYCRQIGIFPQMDIPNSIFEVIAEHYTGDVMKFKTIPDYLDALMISKKFSRLKAVDASELGEHDKALKKQYKLTPKSHLSAPKIFKALRDYQAKKFELFDAKQNGKSPGFEIIFVDHVLSRMNLKQFSFPKSLEYQCSNEELKIIKVIRDESIAERKKASMLDEVKKKKTAMLNELKPSRWANQVKVLSPELKAILKRGNFKSGKESIRLFTIIECRDNHLFAMDYGHKNNYYLFVFKWFSIIIHAENATNMRHTTRTMAGRILRNRFEDILKDLYRSGL